MAESLKLDEYPVGSRVNVLYRDKYYKATVWNKKIQGDTLRYSIHYDGHKKSSRRWVDSDKILGLLVTAGKQPEVASPVTDRADYSIKILYGENEDGQPWTYDQNTSGPEYSPPPTFMANLMSNLMKEDTRHLFDKTQEGFTRSGNSIDLDRVHPDFGKAITAKSPTVAGSGGGDEPHLFFVQNISNLGEQDLNTFSLFFTLSFDRRSFMDYFKQSKKTEGYSVFAVCTKNADGSIGKIHGALLTYLDLKKARWPYPHSGNNSTGHEPFSEDETPPIIVMMSKTNATHEGIGIFTVLCFIKDAYYVCLGLGHPKGLGIVLIKDEELVASYKKKWYIIDTPEGGTGNTTWNEHHPGVFEAFNRFDELRPRPGGQRRVLGVYSRGWAEKSIYPIQLVNSTAPAAAVAEEPAAAAAGGVVPAAADETSDMDHGEEDGGLADETSDIDHGGDYGGLELDDESEERATSAGGVVPAAADEDGDIDHGRDDGGLEFDDESEERAAEPAADAEEVVGEGEFAGVAVEQDSSNHSPPEPAAAALGGFVQCDKNETTVVLQGLCKFILYICEFILYICGTCFSCDLAVV